jgi:hypothetical protein
VLVTVAGGLLAGLLAAGLAWVLLPGAVPRRSPAVAGAPTAAARPTTPSAAAGPDSGEAPRDAAGWQQLVTELYRRRAQAFATGSAVPLGGVYTPGSAQLAADERSLGGLAAERRVLRGFAPEVTAVSAAAVRGDRAELRLVDRWPAYEVVPAASPSAAAVATAPGRADAGVRLVLVRGAAGWRIDSAQRLP